MITLCRNITLGGMVLIMAGILPAQQAKIASPTTTKRIALAPFAKLMKMEFFDWRMQFFTSWHDYQIAQSSGAFILIYGDLRHDISTNTCPTVEMAIDKHLSPAVAQHYHVRVF